MPLKSGNAEILCDAPDCPSFAPETYRAKDVHTYPIACLYRSRSCALHIVGERFHIARVDGTELEFPFGFIRSVLRLDQLVRWVTAAGVELSQREESVGNAARLAETLLGIGHLSRIVDVDEHELRADPSERHGRLIRMTTSWSHGFERSCAAGAWLTRGNGDAKLTGDRDSTHVRIQGLWLSEKDKVYGHLGSYSAELVAYSVEPSST